MKGGVAATWSALKKAHLLTGILNLAWEILQLCGKVVYILLK